MSGVSEQANGRLVLMSRFLIVLDHSLIMGGRAGEEGKIKLPLGPQFSTPRPILLERFLTDLLYLSYTAPMLDVFNSVILLK